MLSHLAILSGLTIGLVSVAQAQNSPADLLQNMERRPTQTHPPSGNAPTAPPDLQSAPPPQIPNPVSQSPQGTSFDKSGYRQPAMIEGFFTQKPDLVTGAAEAEVKAYIHHLSGAAAASCPLVDQRHLNAVVESATGGALTDTNRLIEFGLNKMIEVMEQAANPGALMRNAMDSAVWESDAKADIFVFMSRYGCTDDINRLLRGAVLYLENPPSVRQRKLKVAQDAALTNCNSSFDNAGKYCTCMVKELASLPLSPQDWQVISTSFPQVITINIDKRDLRDKLRLCRG